jgi:hypothetical protein
LYLLFSKLPNIFLSGERNTWNRKKVNEEARREGIYQVLLSQAPLISYLRWMSQLPHEEVITPCP